MSALYLPSGLKLEIVNGVRDALAVRTLRNACREWMTNAIHEISVCQQIRWYFLKYRKAIHTEGYRLYLLRSESGSAIGYGALRLVGSELAITECIAPRFRGRGLGKVLLAALVSAAHREGRNVVAEIWATNQASIRLHEGAGFVLEGSGARFGQEMRRYRLHVARM